MKESEENEIMTEETKPAGHLVFNIDVMLAKRKMSVTKLAEAVGITLANMSILKSGKAKAIKVTTIEKLCDILDCQPGDLFEYVKD
jgi:putative transcriptional regulator